MAVDFEKLDAGLKTLRGLDFETAERKERTAGNNYPDVTFSKSFQARLAATALDVPVADIKELPLREFSQVTGAVFNFLFTPSDDATPSEKSEV